MSIGRDQAAMDMQQKMLSVVHHMREIPELPSEKPKDVNALTEVEFPDEGGVLTYMENHEYPYRGFPFYEMVEKIDTIKKVIRSSFSSFFHETGNRNKLQLALILFVPWLINDAVRATVFSFYRIVERFRIKKEMYCQSMRELHRAFSEEQSKDSEFLNQARDLICMVLEFDNAYRFRFQDVIEELDKRALNKNPSKELCRLLTIMQSREKEQTLRDTWTLVKWVTRVFLFLNRKIRKHVVSILTRLDVEKAALTKEDKWYCHPRSDYTFGFQLHPTEEDSELMKRVDTNRDREEAKRKVREESDTAHKELFKKQNEEMNIDAETDKKILSEVQKVQNTINEKAGNELQEERKRIFRKYLTPEQLGYLEKHDREITEMDDYYNQKLNHVSV